MRLTEASLVADECISPRLIAALRERGLRVDSVRELSRGASDEWIYLRCARRRLPLLTRDSDFGELAFRRAVPYFVILYLRSRSLEASEGLALFDAIAHQYATVSEGDFLTAKRLRNGSISVRLRRPTASR